MHFVVSNRLLKLLNHVDYSRLAYSLAVVALFVELPLQNVLIYQESYWGWSPNLIRDVLRIAFKIPVFLFLLGYFIKELFYPAQYKINKIISCLVFILISYILVVLIINWDNNSLIEFNQKNLRIAAYYFYFFIIGFYSFRGFNHLNRFKVLIIIGLSLMILQIVLFFNYKTLSINLTDLHHNDYIHLFMGYTFAIWAIIALSIVSTKYKLYIYSLSMICLFFLSSRAALYFFAILYPLVIFFINKVTVKKNILIKLLLPVLVFFLFMLISGHRMFSIIIGDDLSMQYRIEIFKKNIPDLINNWILGEYGGFFKYSFPADIYMHNILSYWRQFGLIPFLILISLIVIYAARTAKKLKEPLNISSFLTTTLFLFIMLEVFFAKGYNYSILFILFGFLGNESFIKLIPDEK